MILSPNYTIIGIAGPARAGKTTAAEMLVREIESCDLLVERVGFADPIREIIDEQGVDKITQHDEYRDLAGAIGQIRRKYDQDVWIKQLASRMDASFACNGTTHFVIDDVRFANEIWSIQRAGGYILFVDAKARLDFDLPVYSLESEHIAVQATLHGASWADKVIHNNAGMDSLLASVRSWWDSEQIAASIATL